MYIESGSGATKVTLNGTIFEENAVYGPASSSGGAIYARGGNTQLYVNGAKFRNNVSGLYGGAMTVAHSAKAYMKDLNGEPAEFTGNMVQYATDHAGGGLFINQGYVYMEDAAIYNNYAKDGGGGISSCTKGTAQAKVVNGAAIFDNHVGDTFLDGAEPMVDGIDLRGFNHAYPNPDIESYPDIFFETKDHINRETGEPLVEWINWPIELYERMFNGGLHKWDAKPFDGLKINSPSTQLNSFMAKSNATNKDISGAKVIFTENVATSLGVANAWTATGGAIGCNGLLQLGTGTEIKIVKVWDDERNNDGYRPALDESFLENLIVLANGVPVDLTNPEYTVEILDIKDFDPAALANNIVNVKDPQKDYSGYDAWVVVVSGLDLNDGNGDPIRYSVAEKAVEYYSLIDNIGDNNTYFEMKNRHNIDLVQISAVKKWDDADNNDGMRPESITIRLLADGEEVDKKTVTAKDGWKVSFEDLPRFKDGKEIVYTLAEDSLPGYESEIELVRSEEFGHEDPAKAAASGVDEELDNDKIEELDQPINTVPEVEQITVEKEFVITNTHVPETVTVPVTKTWNDADNKEGLRPASIVIRLLADGKETKDTLVLRAADGWKGSFSDLPAYKDGKKITYTITEDAVVGYETKIAGDAESGFTVTNSHTPKTVTTRPTTPTKQSPPAAPPETPKVTRPEKTTAVQTGDPSRGALFGLLLGAALFGFVFLAAVGARRKED